MNLGRALKKVTGLARSRTSTNIYTPATVADSPSVVSRIDNRFYSANVSELTVQPATYRTVLSARELPGASAVKD